MIEFPDRPPRTRTELFERIRAVIEHGPYDMPEGMGYGGTGAPGKFLEDLVGATAGSHDLPDAIGWELNQPYYAVSQGGNRSEEHHALHGEAVRLERRQRETEFPPYN